MKNKKEYVYETLRENEIKICALQEVEIKKDFNEHLLSSIDYKIEVEIASNKARVATVIHNSITYVRRKDLEKEDLSIIIIDVNMSEKYRIVNLYRSFNPPNGKSPKIAFDEQLILISNIVNTTKDREIIIMGDFNLDEFKHHDVSYRLNNFFESLDSSFDPLNLIQTINFPTWSRTINNIKKESLLDHVYIKNPLTLRNIRHCKPLIGDHCLISFDLCCTPHVPEIVLKRCWKAYTKEILISKLQTVHFELDIEDTQSIWNSFENKLIDIIDEIAPLVPFSNNQTVKSLKPSNTIKRKLNLRKKLLKRQQNNPTNEIRDRIKNLNVEIKLHYLNMKRNNMQRMIIPGNSKSLWSAVKISKNINIAKIPENLYLNNIEVQKEDVPDAFATHFVNKIENIVRECKIDNENVYNGKQKLISQNENFMTADNIVTAVKTLKIKNCEGHDRIPQRILVDGIEILKTPLAVLFDKIYHTKSLPQQWLIAKIIPIHKKGSHSDIENYRPISNLCSTTKIFEKLILLRLQNLETLNRVDLTGKSQHGFKKKHSTATASLTIQSLLARSLDDDNFALMASLDLSSAFDVVNIELLLKRLQIIGIPNDLITLLSEWLKNRFFYVSIDGNNSYVHSSSVGTVQGSILGPILYAIFVSPLFDLSKLTLFADDNYVIRWNRNLTELIVDMQATIELITKWLRQSGLKVNDSKTEICLFHRKDHPPIKIKIKNVEIETKKQMNVLGITFDSKLQWHNQIQNSIQKSKRALGAINIIKKFFSKEQLLTIITSNFYSILYYNSEVWHLPTLSPNLKQKLLSASSAPLKICTKNYNNMISFEALHLINNRALPNQITFYKHALCLHKLYNSDSTNSNWLSLFLNQNFNARYKFTQFSNIARYKIGSNLLHNRFTVLNGKIELDWLNLPFNSFKLKCKTLFLCNINH